MAKQTINVNTPNPLIGVGQSANDRSGDTLRLAFTKINDAIDTIDLNFTDLYTSVGSIIPDQSNNSGKFLTTDGTVIRWSSISQEVGTGNWTFTGDTATVSGATAQIGKNSSETITQESPGGTVSQTTTNTSQVAIDSSSIVITRSVTQVVDDGVTVATDEAGSVASIGNGSSYLKTYSEPDGPNNTQYAEVGTSGSYAYLESRQDDLGGFTLGGVVASPGSVSITTHSIDDKTWLFDQNGNLSLPNTGALTQNYSYTRTSNLQITSPSVIWSSLFSHTSSAKLTIQVEVAEVGDNTGWHVQTCEAVISSRGYANGVNGYGEPVMTVYGVTYTSTTPLMTFSVGRNPINNSIEVTGTQTAAASGTPSLRIHSVEMATSD